MKSAEDVLMARLTPFHLTGPSWARQSKCRRQVKPQLRCQAFCSLEVIEQVAQLKSDSSMHL